MIDLWFADNTAKAAFNCSLCRKNPRTAIERRCQEPGFDNLRKPRNVDAHGPTYTFCPGKATWYEEIAELFEQCRLAMETGILPKEGSLADQDEAFTECFYTFVTRWKDRNYQKVWTDVNGFTKSVLEAVFGKKK